MKNHYLLNQFKGLTLSIVFTAAGFTQSFAQCIATSPFGSATVGVANTTPVTISTAQWAGEYATITVLDAGVYSFNSSVATDYITITDATNNVFSHGVQPHASVLLAAGTYRMHITANASCASQSTNRTTSVNYLQAVPTPLILNAPPNTNATSTLRMFNGTTTHTAFRNAYLVIDSEFSTANIQTGAQVSSLGFVLSSPSTGSVTATLKIYLLNSTDATYSRGSDWSLIVPGMSLVYDASVTIPTGVTTFDVNLSAPFTYGGDNVYIATEWVLTSAPLTTALVYLCNTNLQGQLFNGQSSTTTLPTTLNQSSAWRPEIRWGVQRIADDFEVTKVYARGSNVQTYGYPEDIQVLVTNNGFLTFTKTVSLDISGANTFSANQSVTLGEGQDTLLTFSGFNPTNTGFNVITASVPPDGEPANDSMVWVQETTTDRMGYADTTLTDLSGVGYNMGAGLLLARLDVQGERAVEGVRIRFSDNLPSVGNMVYGVLLDSSGAIVRQSPNHVITTANLENYHTFVFDSVFVVDSEDFYVGLAQVANPTTGYFPMAFQSETPTRANAFFTADLTGAGLATVANFRIMVEAVLGDVPCFDPTNLALTAGCDEIEVTWTSGSGAITSNIEYGPTGFTPGTGTSVMSVSSPYTITGLAPGTYDVWVKDSCGANGSSAFIGPETATTEHAIADFTSSQLTIGVFSFDGLNSSNTTSFAWDFGDGNSDTGATVTHAYAANGTYLVTLIASNACSSDTLSDSILVEGIGVERMIMPTLRVFPNPSNDVLHIEGIPTGAGKSIVQITDMSGRVVAYREIAEGETLRLSVAEWSAGVYHLSINNRLGKVTRPISVVK
jgi:PKD repeat protein